MDSFQYALAFTLGEEGGWSDDPADQGGSTMCGITLTTYRAFTGDAELTPDDLRNIDQGQIALIYRNAYWNPIRGDSLPLGINLMVFDAAVNTGVGGSSSILQAQVGVAVDGVIGPQTLSAVMAFDPAELVNNLALAQAAHYRTLPAFPVFGDGWINRVNARSAAALAMIRGV